MNRRNLFAVRIYALLMLFMCSVVYATEPADFDCGGDTHQQAECMSELFKKADKELNNTYQGLILLVRNHGEEWVQDLRAAQRKWIEFRNLNCTFYGNYLKGGTGAGLYYAACELRMTRQREAELQEKRQEMLRRGYEGKN